MDRSPRAKLERARVTSGDGACRAEVTLSFGAVVETATASCDGEGPAAELRAVAEATISAARALAGENFSCVIRLAEVLEVAGNDFAIVNGTVAARGRSAPVLGSCLVRDDVADAAARATLDAVNRWLEIGARAPDGMDVLG